MGQIDGIEMEGVFDGVVEGIIDGESLSAQHIERQAKNRNETGSNLSIGTRLTKVKRPEWPQALVSPELQGFELWYIF